MKSFHLTGVWRMMIASTEANSSWKIPPNTKCLTAVSFEGTITIEADARDN